MTIPIRRPSSKPLNTGRSFRNGSVVPRTADHSAITFSVGTILSITIPGLDFSRRKMSITDGLKQIIKERQAVLNDAFAKHPERFKGKIPKPMALPGAAWINKPSPENSDPGIH